LYLKNVINNKRPQEMVEERNLEIVILLYSKTHSYNIKKESVAQG